MNMENLRNSLLLSDNGDIYEELLDYMRTPDQTSIESIIEKTPAELKNDITEYTEQLLSLFLNNREEYRRSYTYGQIIIWQEILETYKKLIKQRNFIESINLIYDENNYYLANLELKKILLAYSSMQNSLSELEDAFGVDRFLDRISGKTFEVLNTIIRQTKIKLEKKIRTYKDLYQSKWNSTNVYSTIIHKLIQRNDTNQVCDQFTSKNKQCIFLLIDGLGFCQYLWNTHIHANQYNYTFKENIFYWLSESKLSKEMILGSSLITDTGSGLAQIYFGQEANRTNIFASKLRRKFSSDKFFETKRITPTEFSSFFKHNNSITNVVRSCGLDAKVYYCSKYSDDVSGFSKNLFDMAEVKQVLPAERVFSVLLEDIDDGMTEGLQVLYLTGIDNTGHTMGAYSRFERMEHSKFDGLFRNFLVELAYNHPDLFDNERSIIISADHGMYESSNLMINRTTILDYLRNDGIRGIKLVENNRALLVYNEGESSLEQIQKSLEDFFLEKGILVDIRAFSNGINDSDIIPDLAIRLISEGLFFSNDRINGHLLHYGGHGGFSLDEVFIPFIEIPLTTELYSSIDKRFLSKK